MYSFYNRKFWYVSPLTHHILAVNVAALLVLVLGMLYTGQYERGLIEGEQNALKAEGRLFAAALAESGMKPSRGDVPGLTDDFARQMMRRLSTAPDTRIAVFSKAGHVVLGSQESPARAPSEETSSGKRLADFLVNVLPVRLRLPPFPAMGSSAAVNYPGVPEALANGTAQTGAWRDANGRILLSAALPVQAGKNLLGVLFLTRSGVSVDEAVHAVQLTVLRAFLAALLVTLLLSIYLSEIIVYPLVRLAEATQKVRQSILLKDAVPDLSYRGDEIGDLSRAFREMTLALSDRIDAISRFASDVAHEIKNPLASVKSAVETFSLVKEPEQQQKLLAVIHDDINRINRLITDISNASRLDSDLGRAERRTIDLAELLRAVVEAERTRIGDPEKIVLYLDEKRKLPVTANDVQLAQVAHNLIDNALSFVSKEGQITVRAGLQSDRVFMHVDNPGPAIPESKLETVFERFYSERPRSEKFGTHSGLGLSICRQIIRMHQGEIFAENLKDRSGHAKGVRFMILLPAGAGTK